MPLAPKALLTGSGGMGNAIADRLAGEGYEVVRLLSHRDPSVAGTYVDFADEASILSALREVTGPIEAIVVSHAYAENGDLATTTPLAWRRVLEVNLNSVFTILHAAIDQLAPGGSVVVVSSTAGLDRSKNSGPHYTAAKAGVNGLVRHLATELAQRDVRINAVCAGLIDDDLAAAVNTPETFAAAVSSVPMGRPGDPSEIADAVSFLLSSDASYMTGAFLTVAGGTHR